VIRGAQKRTNRIVSEKRKEGSNRVQGNPGYRPLKKGVRITGRKEKKVRGKGKTSSDRRKTAANINRKRGNSPWESINLQEEEGGWRKKTFVGQLCQGKDSNSAGVRVRKKRQIRNTDGQKRASRLAIEEKRGDDSRKI